MRYMLLTRESQDALLESLTAMPDVLDEAFARLSTTDARTAGADGFSPVEQCWHLADLERDGYSGRIRRCDVPAMMAEHDAAHRQEIEAWVRQRNR